MRAVTPARRLAVLALTGLVLAGCSAGGDAPPVTAGGLTAKTTSAGPVEVQVIPKRVNATEAVFAVKLDNHQIELSMDLAAKASLTVGTTRWSAARWSGDGPSGHHREGTLTFTAAGPASGPVVLQLGGLPGPAKFEWALPTGGGSS